MDFKVEKADLIGIGESNCLLLKLSSVFAHHLGVFLQIIS